MADDLDKSITSKFKHFYDERPTSEIQITNQLVIALTESNLNRLSSLNYQNKVNLLQRPLSLKKQDFLYVCFHGVPVNADEFTNLDLPGEMLMIAPQTFQIGLTEQERYERLKYVAFELQSQSINNLINQKSKTKQLVLVYHSYGSYLASVYLHYFGSVRVVGMIDLGGASVTMFLPNQLYAIQTQKKGLKALVEEINSLYNDKSQLDSNKLADYQGMLIIGQSRAKTLSTIHDYLTGIGFYQMYTKIRNWPKVLKLMIYGAKDPLISNDLFGEKVSWYCYQNKINKIDEERMTKKYKQKYGMKITNLQERFIFQIEGGYHSIHMQKNYRSQIKNIIKEYLSFIEVEENQPAKL